MNEKESETWWEINQFNFGLVKFDSPVGYTCGKVAQTTVYKFGTRSSSGQEIKTLKTAQKWELKLKELAQISRQDMLSEKRHSPG